MPFLFKLYSTSCTNFLSRGVINIVFITEVDLLQDQCTTFVCARRSAPGQVVMWLKCGLNVLPPDLSQDVHVNDVTLRPSVPVVPLEGDTTSMEAQNDAD